MSLNIVSWLLAKYMSSCNFKFIFFPISLLKFQWFIVRELHRLFVLKKCSCFERLLSLMEPRYTKTLHFTKMTLRSVSTEAYNSVVFFLF